MEGLNKAIKRGEGGWKIIIASGPVIIENGKILLSKDSKDDFYKLPGGTIKLGKESMEEGCIRKVKEEINGEIEILKPLDPFVLWENPTTKEPMIIVLANYLAKIKNKDGIKPLDDTLEIRWLSMQDIMKNKHKVSPNTKMTLEYLRKRGDIK